MNPFVRLAEPRDIDAICALLHEKMNTRIPVERWRNLMTYHWLADKPDFGRVVESDGKILGFCGMVYADRVIGDDRRAERIVSMSSWYLDKSMRGKGLGKGMLVSAISDPTLTYATLTNSRKPLAIVEALGFQVLEDHRFLWKKTKSSEHSLKLVTDVSNIGNLIEPFQRKILDDMASQPLTPVLIQADGKQVLVVFSIKRKKNDILWYDVMYVSDSSLFTQNAQSVANELLTEESSILASDARFIVGMPETAEHERLPVSRYYISQRVQPHEIDHLYSELQLLDLKLD